jgi:hypothetical protein
MTMTGGINATTVAIDDAGAAGGFVDADSFSQFARMCRGTCDALCARIRRLPFWFQL